jgi:hypothetical protein
MYFERCWHNLSSRCRRLRQGPKGLRRPGDRCDRSGRSQPAAAATGLVNLIVIKCRGNAVATPSTPRYPSPVAATSANGLGGPNHERRNSAKTRMQALFLCLHFCVMADCAGTPSGVPVPFVPVRQPCAIRHPNLLGGRRWWFPIRKESSPCTTLEIRPPHTSRHTKPEVPDDHSTAPDHPR